MTITLSLALGKTTKVIEGRLVERLDGVETARVPSFTMVLNGGAGGLPEPGLRTAFLSAPAEIALDAMGRTVMGDGYLLMTVAKNKRSARFVGQVPDGEPFSFSAAAQGKSFAFTQALERNGTLAGLVRVMDFENDAAGMLADLLWMKPEFRGRSRARYSAEAFSTGLELLGLEYPVLTKTAPPPLELNLNLGMNARLTLEGGDLPNALEIPLCIQGAGVTGLDGNALKLQFRPDLGTFSGSFKHPATGKFVPFKGAFRAPFDTEPGQGRGVFRGLTSAGAVADRRELNATKFSPILRRRPTLIP